MSILEMIGKLPFVGLAEKIPASAREKAPFINKAIPWANHIACGLIAVVLIGGIAACGGGSGSSGGGSARSSGRETPASDFAYRATEDGAGVVITKYTGNGGKVVVPSKIEGLPVVEIGSEVFRSDEITELVIPNSVVTIGSGLCVDAGSLTKVTLPDGLKIINFGLFFDCKNLTTINLPSGLEEIAPNAFAGCGKLPLATRAKLKALGYEGGF